MYTYLSMYFTVELSLFFKSDPAHSCGFYVVFMFHKYISKKEIKNQSDEKKQNFAV